MFRIYNLQYKKQHNKLCYTFFAFSFVLVQSSRIRQKKFKHANSHQFLKVFLLWSWIRRNNIGHVVQDKRIMCECHYAVWLCPGDKITYVRVFSQGILSLMCIFIHVFHVYELFYCAITFEILHFSLSGFDTFLANYVNTTK